MKNVVPADLVILTADHGKSAAALGTRATFADVAASLATYFALSNAWPVGEAFV